MKRFCVSFVLCAFLSVFGFSCNTPQTADLSPVDQATPSATLTPLPTDTPAPTATNTLTPTASNTPTSTPNATSTVMAATKEAVVEQQHIELTQAFLSAQRTQQAEDELWSKIAADSKMTLSKGRLYTVDDFEENWAQRNWYRWWWFDYNLADFVIMTHIDWESAPSDKTAYGGCGFVFRIKDESNHLLVLLSVFGTAGLGQMTPSGFEYLAWDRKLDINTEREGSADFVVVVEKEIITAYVNGEQSFRKLVARTNSGDIGYTIISGTNADFGTNCKFTNTRIWELE